MGGLVHRRQHHRYEQGLGYRRHCPSYLVIFIPAFTCLWLSGLLAPFSHCRSFLSSCCAVIALSSPSHPDLSPIFNYFVLPLMHYPGCSPSFLLCPATPTLTCSVLTYPLSVQAVYTVLYMYVLLQTLYTYFVLLLLHCPVLYLPPSCPSLSPFSPVLVPPALFCPVLFYPVLVYNLFPCFLSTLIQIFFIYPRYKLF